MPVSQAHPRIDPMFLGLRTLIYPVTDLDRARTWYTRVLGIDPYYDEAPYVGYDVGGYELGLFAAGKPADGPGAFWGVADVETALQHLVDAGATPDGGIADVGGGIRMASVKDPDGFTFGIIENPVFQAAPVSSPGPGR
jgi:catechol 2,3-dioxygenase-like lactoylglutathione lyase family enzyme